MDFRRSAPLDGRRRRVLMEEIAAPADDASSSSTTPTPTEARQPVRAYGPAVLNDRQPRITDLVPVRPLALSAALLSSVVALALVVGLHVATQEARRGPLAEVLAPLDMARPASIARWLAATWLAAAAALATLIYRIRLHRADDYQGRYRIWLWAAAALAWLSLDVVARLHVPLGWWLARLGGSAPSPAGTAVLLAWMSLYGIMFSALGLRLAAELRFSPAALATLTLAAGLYLVAAAFALGGLTSGDAQRDAILGPLTSLTAHGLVLWTALWYARHVYLDAAGRLMVRIEAAPRAAYTRRFGWWGRGRRQRSRADDAADASPGGSVPITSGESTVTERPAAARSASGTSSPRGPVQDGEPTDDDAQTAHEHLSRAERRRLKRLARADQQRRAA
jgi:hypothetical protein